ncbi:hypothetical protein [Sphingomonas prati]|uniref:Phosphatidate cytidylyltransferase n=1 Tax=Sphingomonas prati TaxID=1843237 RepID=A0A7W9BSF3_9SPHN|nr:hypothetical protein [Sphingomonas prati]MBB5729307.1 hypothetical protein [Sphingomonas prati]GGE78470.1 hypothetical protein GCM10011404_08940 [Sphingomonas prati]
MTAVRALVRDELALPVDPRVTAMAAAIAARHGDAARAVLFYGSCLRTTELDGQMLDFYLIVSEYRAAYPARWMRVANRLLPPNVFPFAHHGLASKYAVLSEADLQALCGPEAATVSVWARFAQPSRLVWRSDDAAAERVVGSVARAGPTAMALALPMVAPAERGDPLAVWRAAFSQTYRAELRAERDDRSGSIVDADPERYRRFGAAILPGLVGAGNEARWRRLRRNGKSLTVLRLMKASATFAGGIDYLAWKINRHAGTKIAIRPWQRRHPLLGALVLLPRLLRGGAVR